MGKPKLSGRNVATSISQLNPPAVKTLPTTPGTQKPKLSAMPRYENAAKPRPHTIASVIKPAKQ